MGVREDLEALERASTRQRSDVDNMGYEEAKAAHQRAHEISTDNLSQLQRSQLYTLKQRLSHRVQTADPVKYQADMDDFRQRTQLELERRRANRPLWQKVFGISDDEYQRGT